MERVFIRDHAYVGLHLIRELIFAMGFVVDGTDERTREMDGHAAVPGLKHDLERLVVYTAHLHGGDEWVRSNRGVRRSGVHTRLNFMEPL